MDGKSAVEIIKQKFGRIDHRVKLNLQRGREFSATMTVQGIMVDNLGIQPLLPWMVFEEVINLLIQNGGRAEKGDAMGCRLGDAGLPLNSIEGHIAYKFYGKNVGDSVFRRISPISAILEWAGLCNSTRGELILRRDKFTA